MTTTIAVVRRILEKNDRAAEENRARFDAMHTTCINLLGGAGCGKTSLLEAVLPKLKGDWRVAVLEGDPATTRDAERIAALDVPVVQLLTEGGCHLTATLVQRALDRVPLNELDLLIIENVGNPICPANFDLGEHLRIVALSIAEGSDKPSKYPLLVKKADVVVLTKHDLLEHVDYDLDGVNEDLRRVHPNVEIMATDVKTPRGIDRLADWIGRHMRREALWDQ